MHDVSELFRATFCILVGHLGVLKPLNPLQRGLQEHDPVLDDLRVLEVVFQCFMISCPLGDLMVMRRTKMIPPCSFAINLPLRMPPENVTVTLTAQQMPNSLAKVFSLFEDTDVGPH